MALNLIARIDAPRGLLAVEKVALVYNLITSILIVVLFGRMSHPDLMLGQRLLIAATTFVLLIVHHWWPCRLMVLLRVVFQMSLLSYWYPDTYEFNQLFPNLDHLFATTEQFIFGGQPSVWFSNTFPHLIVSEAFNMGYFFYYPMIAVIVFFYFFRHYERFDKVCFIIVTAFFLYYFIYIFVPVAGPQFYFPAIGYDKVAHGIFPSVGDYFRTHADLLPGPGYKPGFFYRLVEASQGVGERPTAAFPSSHVGMATISMILAWRGGKILFCCLLPIYVLLCVATVYIQAHYVIDSLVGFFSAFAIYALVLWLYRRFF